LTKQEAKLRQKQAALEQQEAQLAAHLDEKRRQLLDLQEQIRKDHACLKEERSAHERHVAEATRMLTLTQDEVADSRKQIQLDRRRLQALRRRLKQRWHRQWAAERAAWQQRQEELTRREQRLGQEKERLLKERTDWDQARMRWNGEIELGRRELQAGRDSLSRDWEQLQETQDGLLKQQTDLAARDEKFVAEKRRWEKTLLSLVKEAEGLENRIRNYRLKLAEEEQTVACLERQGNDQAESTPTAREPAAAPLPRHAIAIAGPPSDEIQESTTHLRAWEAGLQQYWAVLEKLVGDLADQRLHLAEQCERLALIQARRQEECDAATQRQQAVDNHLLGREQELEKISADLRRRQEETARAQICLEAFRARLSAQIATWECERQRWIAHLSGREELVERLVTIFGELHSQWRERHHQELEQFRARGENLEETRRELTAHRDLWIQLCKQLERQKRTLLARFLSVEEHGSNSLRKGKRIIASNQFVKWGRRLAALSAALERTLVQERRAFQVEVAGVDKQFADLQKLKQETSIRETDLAGREIALEHSRAVAESQYVRLHQELQRFNVQKDAYERQLTELKEEVERLAGLFLEEHDTVTLPIAKAA
jgi:chromosome segregation ATPase